MSNIGAEKLRAWLARKGRGAALRLARDLGCTPGMVSVWASGKRKPSTIWRLALRKKTGIGLLCWDQLLEIHSVQSAA